MSKITDAYEKLHTLISETLPGYKRLPNAYEVSDNPDHVLMQGYAIAIERGNSSRVAQSSVGVTRQMVIKLTKKFYSLALDSDSKASCEKSILEDQMLIIKALESDKTLGGIIYECEYEGDSGVEYVASKTPFLKTETVITLQYAENL